MHWNIQHQLDGTLKPILSHEYVKEYVRIPIYIYGTANSHIILQWDQFDFKIESRYKI